MFSNRSEIINNQCRLCLSAEDKMEPLFHGDNELLEKIFDLTTIKLQQIDGIPSNICEICKSKLIILFKFKQKCLHTDMFLQNYIQNIENEKNYTNDVKIEEDIACEISKINSNDMVNNNLNTFDKIEEISSVIKSEINLCDEELNNNNNNYETVNTENELPKNNSINSITKSSKKKGNRKLCKICGESQSNLKQHMIIHSNTKLYKCIFCSKEFSYRGTYKYHLNMHTGNKPYKCKVCNKAFAEPSSLHRHAVVHTGERKYHCDICGKSFGYSNVLKLHYKTHTKEYDKLYKCDICPKIYVSSANLIAHKRVHNNERPFYCTICNASFSYNSVLKRHMNIHQI